MKAQVTITDVEGTRPVYHHVGHSPTGYSWGYGGDGPHDLARSILYDRLGSWITRHGKLFARNPRAEPFNPYAYGGA